jgi:RNA recognition motif-containing protein
MNIYVGNLSRQAAEQEVRALFEAFGTIKSVKLVKDFQTGEPKGFAFVEMPNNEEGNEAIRSLDSQEFQQRRLKVNEAKPKGPQVYNSFSSQYGYKNRFEKY